jgi:hypothetical protein
MIIDRIVSAFASLGRNGATKPPTFERNSSAAAWEYHVASALETSARARKQAAVKTCIETGVMFDHVAEPLPPGTERIIYDNDLVQMQVKVNKPTESIDHKAFCNALEAEGVDVRIIAAAALRATKTNKAAHAFRTIMKGGTESGSDSIK